MRSAFDKPCPKCGKGCTVCFDAGRSHAEAQLAAVVEEKLAAQELVIEQEARADIAESQRDRLAAALREARGWWPPKATDPPPIMNPSQPFLDHLDALLTEGGLTE